METDQRNSAQMVGGCQARRFLDGSGCRETRESGFRRHREGEEHGGEVSARGERWFCVERQRGRVVDEYGQQNHK
jgi:hypothetical protein